MNPDPITNLANSEVRKLLDLQALAEKLPDGFNDSSRITRNPLPGTGLPTIKILPNQDTAQSLLSKAKKPRLTSQPLVSASFVSSLEEATDPLTLEEAKARLDWPRWLEAL